MYEEYAMQTQPTSMGDTVIGVYAYVIVILLYVYMSFMMYRAAHRAGCADTAWWAFVPVMNTLLLIQMARKPMSWILWLLIPGVNIVAFFMLWMSAARNAGQSAAWGFLVMIPPITLIAIFMLGYGHQPYDYEYPDETPMPPSRPRTPSNVG